MSSKRKQFSELFASFSPFRYEVNEESHISGKKPKINPFLIKSFLESICKRFRKNAIRDYFNLKTETQMRKNSFQKPMQINPSKKWNKREAVASSLCSSLISIWGPGERHVGISKRSSFFSSFRRPETFFKHEQGYQPAGALTVCIDIIQDTKNTKYEVESWKTDNANFENGLLGFEK